MEPKLESGNAVLQTIHSSDNGRALKLLQQRQKRAEELENAKSSIDAETQKRKLFVIDEKYKGSTTEALEEAFKQETVGLVSAEEFRKKRQRLTEFIAERERQEREVLVEKKVKTSKIQKNTLSFMDDVDDDDDDGAEEEPPVANTAAAAGAASSDAPVALPAAVASGDLDALKAAAASAAAAAAAAAPEVKALGKDPTVNTDFLHDRAREARRAAEREALVKLYRATEEKAKAEILEVTYSYWDGAGHRRVVQVPKGATISEFLRECQRKLEVEFTELRGVSVDSLMYIKEDLVLPHTVTFYELIKDKARGKSGPLFHFDVHDDVRMVADASVEKDEVGASGRSTATLAAGATWRRVAAACSCGAAAVQSHAGKIVDRKWYERNKHIFPASRWELYDPSKTYEKYTIHGHDDWSATTGQ